jgi:opacity protein-like surface antigen
MLLPLAAANAAAQQITSPYRYVESTHAIAPFAGYVATGKGVLNLGPQSAPAFGIRYGLRLSGPLTAEGDVSWVSTKRTVFDTIPGDTTLRTTGEADMQLLSVQAGIRFNITGPRTFHGFQPYVAAGGGVIFDMASDSPAEEDVASNARLDFGTRFGFHVGGGLDAFLSERMSLRLDARSIMWKLVTPEPFLLGAPALYRPQDEWLQNFYVSGGISIHF